MCSLILHGRKYTQQGRPGAKASPAYVYMVGAPLSHQGISVDWEQILVHDMAVHTCTCIGNVKPDKQISTVLVQVHGKCPHTCTCTYIYMCIYKPFSLTATVVGQSMCSILTMHSSYIMT